jgi:hypothetical protein
MIFLEDTLSLETRLHAVAGSRLSGVAGVSSPGGVPLNGVVHPPLDPQIVGATACVVPNATGAEKRHQDPLTSRRQQR